MRRHYYRQQYQVPKELKPPKKKRSQPLVLPNWDDTIHDLSHLKLSPEEQLRRRLSRVSKNQLGVAVLSSRHTLQSGGSSRYTPSTGSADTAALSSGSDNDDDDGDGVYPDASNQEKDLPHLQQQRQRGRRHLHWGARGSAAPAQADSDDEDDLCQWQGGRNSPLQQQQQEQGLGALRDISNSNQTAQGLHHSHQQLKQQQQHDAARTVKVAAGAAGGAVEVEQDGRLLVEAQVLQLLLDKIDILEHQLRQRQRSAGGLGGSTEAHQQQHGVEQQLQEQLELTQQQLARLQEEHMQYVDRTSNLLERLQAQMQHLMKQAPGLAAAAGAAGELQDFAAEHQSLRQPQPAGAWGVPASSCSSPQRPPAAAAAAAAVPGLRSSAAGSAAGRSPAKALLRPATAVSVTALQHRPGSAGGSSSIAASPARASAAHAAGASSSRLGSAAAQFAEAAALPSYAEMRQRRSAAGAAAAWAGGTCFTAAPAVTAPAAATATAAASADDRNAYLASMLGASSQTGSQLPLSGAVPAPNCGAFTTAGTSAAALSGGAASQQQQQQQRRPGSWSNADQVAPVISARSSAGPDAGLRLAPGLAAAAFGALPGTHDAGWGLAEGLPRSAVSRVFTAAGVAEAAELPHRPRVLLDQLAGNVSLLDHLRAAQAAAAAGASGAGDAGGMRV